MLTALLLESTQSAQNDSAHVDPRGIKFGQSSDARYRASLSPSRAAFLRWPPAEFEAFARTAGVHIDRVIVTSTGLSLELPKRALGTSGRRVVTEMQMYKSGPRQTMAQVSKPVNIQMRS